MDSRYNNDKYAKRDDERRSRKLFIGGVSFSTNDEDFFKYFAKYGELEDCVLIREKDTGQSRGFGFVTYKDKAVSEHVAKQQLYLDGRRLDPKPSISKHRNQTTKVFVGGLHDDTAEAELSEHFTTFGEVLEVNIMYDRFTNAPRGFGFVTFKETDVAQNVIHWDKDHMIHGKKVDCKPATARKDAFKRNPHEEEIIPHTKPLIKPTSREERWRKYHGGDDEFKRSAHSHIHPPIHPYPPTSTDPYTHSSYAHHHSAYSHGYPTHSSYAHSSYAPPPPPPQQQPYPPHAPAPHSTSYSYGYNTAPTTLPHSSYDTRSHTHAPHTTVPAPAPTTTTTTPTTHYAANPHYDPYYRPPTHYPPPPAPTEYKYATAPTQVTQQPQPHYPPPPNSSATTTASATSQPHGQRYDYYSQYPASVGTQPQGNVVESKTGGVKEEKGNVLTQTQVIATVKPIQTGLNVAVQQPQVVPSSYGPSRGSKATNSAQGARYNAY